MCFDYISLTNEPQILKSIFRIFHIGDMIISENSYNISLATGKLLIGQVCKYGPIIFV